MWTVNRTWNLCRHTLTEYLTEYIVKKGKKGWYKYIVEAGSHEVFIHL